MPEPVRSGQRYMPGLDGLRALAVLAVIAYHKQFGWAPGGMLGVGVFFTLSGYLITDLLLGQWVAHSRLNLGDFWLRRARRLLPALFVMLAVVTAWATVASPSWLGSLRGVVAAAATCSGRYYIATHSSYFARFNLRSLLATGPYSEANMVTWDNTLLRACARYPNMRVFNWAAYARTKWYISDGVHFTSAGYAVRGRMIAQALARAFPRTGHSTGCLVS